MIEIKNSDNLKIFIHVFGCRSSLCEGEYIAGTLKAIGAEITEDVSEEFSAAVLVTCSVTHEADRKCRQAVRRLRRLLGDDGVLAVCGCWGQGLEADEAYDLGVDILAGSKGKDLLPEALMNMIQTGRDFWDLRTQDISKPSEWEELAINSPIMHSRAFVKIQDGCDHFCTYCVIPFLRGRPVSRPGENIIAEIRRLLDSGTKEIIFTGIHLGMYGRDIGSSLADLIREVSKIKELSRLRLGSLEPFCLDENLLNALSECEAFCPHLHLPLQSGDDEILSAMRRGYTARDFVNVCAHARERIADDLHISSDILVGFPGEGSRAFQHTLDIMKEAGLGRVHVFPYSPRNGTIAAGLPKQITREVKAHRTAEAITLGRRLYNSYVRSFDKRDVEILIEKNFKGHTRHYIEANCDGEDNELIKARVLYCDYDKLECERRD